MPEDLLSLTFAALADPTRRAILAHLAHHEATVNELAEPFEMTLQGVSKHLKVLEKAGLISRSREGQFRPCRLEPRQMDSAVAWIERHRQTWEERFDQLEVHLRNIQQPKSQQATIHQQSNRHQQATHIPVASSRRLRKGPST